MRLLSQFETFSFFMIRFHKYKNAQKYYKAPKSTKKQPIYKNTTNLRFIDLRFINLRFIDLRFINLRLIDLRFINLRLST